MKIRIESAFHGTSAEMSYFTSNRAALQLTGRQLRRLFSEICPVEGCDCFRDAAVTIDGKPVAVAWIDLDADDERPAIELALPQA